MKRKKNDEKHQSDNETFANQKSQLFSTTFSRNLKYFCGNINNFIEILKIKILKNDDGLKSYLIT